MQTKTAWNEQTALKVLRKAKDLVYTQGGPKQSPRQQMQLTVDSEDDSVNTLQPGMLPRMSGLGGTESPHFESEANQPWANEEMKKRAQHMFFSKGNSGLEMLRTVLETSIKVSPKAKRSKRTRRVASLVPKVMRSCCRRRMTVDQSMSTSNTEAPRGKPCGPNFHTDSR